ncbi:MAG: (p)ppGpp synthase/HD superfamily hydrolase [Pirellulaceae bacterium]|jgi:(p)ppGpp synthase/HD superfamily hydrolase
MNESADSIVLRAAKFAHQSHEGQRRKYNDAPFIMHPIRVAGRVATLPASTDVMVAAAFLHDVVEDTPVELAEIVDRFGSDVALLVEHLTEPSQEMVAPRAERKAIDLAYMKQADPRAKVIRLVDRIDNLRDMNGAADDKLRRFVEESQQLVAEIGDACCELQAEANSLFQQLLARLEKDS